MQFSFAAVLALATAAFAQRAALPNPDFNPVTSPTEHQKVQAGSTLTIKWTVPEKFANTKVNLILIGGPEQNLQTPLLNIVDGLDNSLGEYAWSVPADQGGFPWYGITIEDVADPVNNYQFSPPFDIEGGAATSTVTLTTASGTATVILSSAVPTTTSVSSSAVETTSSSIKETSSEIKTTSVVVSSSVAPVPTLVTVTSSSVAASSTSSVAAAESSPVLVNDSAAVQGKAGVFAVLGGLAVALML